MVRPSVLKNENFDGKRGKVAAIIENNAFTRFITLVILMNAVTLGLETNPQMLNEYGTFLHAFDKIALAIFTIEIALKLYAYRWPFFRAGWNIFDFTIVAIALIPASGPLAVLRTLRVLRVLRLVSVIPSMRRVIAALMHSIPGMASIMSVLLVIFYVSAVLVTKMFVGHPDPDIADKFDSIGSSMYTLFQVMTLEGWSAEIVAPVMEEYPYAWLFFIPFIIVTSFAVLNLFIGIIVDAMNIIHEKGDYSEIENDEKPMSTIEELHALRDEIAEIKELIEQKR